MEIQYAKLGTGILPLCIMSICMSAFKGSIIFSTLIILLICLRILRHMFLVLDSMK